MFARARRELPACGDVSFEGLCYLAERDPENIVKQECHALERREPLECQHKRKSNVVLFFFCHDRIRKPGAEVGLTQSACGFELVQAEPGNGPTHEGLGLANLAAIDRYPASERLLYDVLGIMD